MKTTVNFFRTLLLAVLTLTFGACGEDSLLSELGLDGQTATKTDGAGEVWDGEADTSWYQADATEFQIATAEQLAGLAKLVNAGYTFEGKTIRLTADILLNDISDWENWNESTEGLNSWTPIGSDANRFTGTLDGDGHSVSGIYINSTASSQGLVGYLGSGGTLQNLGVKASYIKGGGVVGGLCGFNNGGTVTNCCNTGSVTGSYYVGGVCGRNSSTVTNCYNTGSVKGSGFVGGVCGWNEMMGNISNCYNSGNVTGTGNNVGGVCGASTGTVSNCYNTGSVTGSNYVGGVCGINTSIVTNCYYLTGTANSGIGSGSGEATAKTAAEFASGEVAFLLQGEQTEQVWGQTIGTEDYPVLGGKKVYNNNGTYSNMAMDGDFYLISTADELRLFASMVNSGQTSINGRLTADIELNNTTGWENWGSTPPANSWTPIGSNEQPFTGIFDGQGHTVSGIYVNSGNNCQGFFGATNGATITNLHTAQGYIRGNGSVGGIVGNAEGGSIKDCTNGCTIASTDSSNGGIIGNGMGIQITGCTNNGPLVAGQFQNGGIAGTVENSTIDRCVNNADITVADHAGGIAGYNTNGTVSNCLNKGNVSTSNAFYTYTAGIVANNCGTGSVVKNCLNLGTISGQGGTGCRQNSIVCATDANGTRADNCYSIYISGVSVGLADNSRNVTDEELRSGEVASLLGDAWGQNIGSDGSPVLDSNSSTKVYAITIYNGTSIAETSYHNRGYSIPLTGNAIAIVDAGSPFSGTNIVEKDGDNNYTCAELVLTDDADFYTPVKFTATKATYTRMPKVWANGESGWETLCLPFSGTLYAGEEAKEPVDVASNNGAYWLRSLTGFTEPNILIFASPATAADNQIEAGMPYIIALPGNTFGSESLEGQTISVRGTNVTVTNEAQLVAAGSMFDFTGTFATKACNASYRLNSENGTSGAGDLFVLDTQKTVLAPFRCCIDVTGLNMGGASTRSASGLPKELRIGQ